jgi:hypothetical protein
MSDTNRVEEQLKKWEASRPKRLFVPGDYLDNYLEFLEKVKLAFKDTNDMFERRSLIRVDEEIKKSLKLLRPDIFMRLGKAVDDYVAPAIEKILVGAKLMEPLDRFADLAPKWISPNMSRIEREQKVGDWIRLGERLNKYGLVGDLYDLSLTRVSNGERSFTTMNRLPQYGPKTKVETHIERSDSGRYYPVSYDLIGYKGLIPDQVEVNGVKVRDLEKLMHAIPWEYDFTRGNERIVNDSVENEKIRQSVARVFDDLGKLWESEDPVARKVHDQLAVTYFMDTPNEGLVSNMTDIKKQFEHKIHVDLTPASPYPLRPDQAMQLLSLGSVNLSTNMNRPDLPWLGIQHSVRNENGFYKVQPIENSENFSVRTALAKAGVVGFHGFRNDNEAMKALYRGETVKAELIQNGQHVQRFMYVDPLQQRMVVDWIQTEREGLFKRDELLSEKLEQYLGRQNGTYVAPVVVQSHDTRPLEKAAVQQPSFWNVEEGRQVEINGTNLASLEKQMAEMGVEPRVAKEVLEMFAKSEDANIQIPYKQQIGEDTALAQLRFRKDPDTDWVHFVGYDMKVSLVDTQKEVNQRYYYNPEDPVNNYSLEEAYRMAAGNAVSRMVGSGDQVQEVWRSLGVDQELSPKHNHLIISTPFDLEKAMLEYPHKNEFVKYLAPGHSIDNILERARKGEDVHFSISKNGITEVMNLKVNLKENDISVVRSADSQKEGAGQQQSTGNKKGQGPESAETELRLNRSMVV